MKPADPDNIGLQNRCSTAELCRQNTRNNDEIWTSLPIQTPGKGGIGGTGQRSCQPQKQDHLFLGRSPIDELLARASAHSPEAARKARLVAVAIDQLPHKTPLDQPRELAKIDQDVRALSEMMGVR